MEKYRLYIDETGNPDIRSSDNPNHRYLSLTGVIFNLNYIETAVFQPLECLKRKYFKSHPDEPVILHRKDMLNRRHPFECLGDQDIRNNFDNELLALLTKWDYIVISVLIDKLDHRERYTTWRFDPYHYGLKIMVERYLLFLESNSVCGDVMAESRGGKEDKRLKDSFEQLILQGSEYINSERFLNSITSKQLKVKAKYNNVSGLQIADILAHPSRREMIAEIMGVALSGSDVFGDKIISILQGKYYQKNGKVEGYGKKKLP